MKLPTGHQLLLGAVFGFSLGLSALAVIAAVPLPQSTGQTPPRGLAEKGVNDPALGKIALAGGKRGH